MVFLENSVVRFMGMISYPFYLIHQNLAYLIEYNVSNRFDKIPLNFVAGGGVSYGAFNRYRSVLYG